MKPYQFLYFLVLLFLSYLIYPFLIVLIGFWIVFVVIVKQKGYDQQLSAKKRKYFNMIAFGYLPVEIIVKLILVSDVLPQSLISPLNVAEHFVYSALLTIIIYVLLINHLTKLNTFGKIIMLVGVVSVLGNFNEIAALVIRQLTIESPNYEYYYLDSIKDILVNFCGALAGSFWWVKVKK